jgi:transposase InsO family protein
LSTTAVLGSWSDRLAPANPGATRRGRRLADRWGRRRRADRVAGSRRRAGFGGQRAGREHRQVTTLHVEHVAEPLVRTDDGRIELADAVGCDVARFYALVTGLDAYSRRVVGWSIDSSPTAALVTNALGMAIDTRTPTSETVIHSDQGVQFASWAFTKRATDSGLLPSMGSVGDCYDNAMIEAFWSRMQVELLDRQRWTTRIELANAIFEYIEIFHNRHRRHSALDMHTPTEYENHLHVVA